jgi:hypothetical protein
MYAATMDERAIEQVCRDCGRPLSMRDGNAHAVRCAQCFDDFLRARDADFLSSYAELGVTSRRLIAETALRALVMAPPPHRKVLAMHMMEQYVNVATDLIGLYAAIKQRGHEQGGAPVMKVFLDFQLDRTLAIAFFREMALTPQPDLLSGLGLPLPEQIAQRCPSLSKKDARDFKRTLEQLLYDLAFTAKNGETAALALAQMAGERANGGLGGGALVHQSSWLDDVGLRGDQVASMALDMQRRTVNLTAITVDEKKLEQLLTQINAMTRASQNLIYAVLTMYQVAGRAKSKTTRPAVGEASG